jgi:hypothetical protein
LNCGLQFISENLGIDILDISGQPTGLNDTSSGLVSWLRMRDIKRMLSSGQRVSANNSGSCFRFSLGQVAVSFQGTARSNLVLQRFLKQFVAA